MKKQLRSALSTEGRRMAGARALWVANGMKREQMGKPIVAIANSFTQFVPGHTHLHDVGQLVKSEIEKLGCYAAEFNTIAIDDGIAMGHDGMLYSLPSRDLIADSVEYMVNAHKADALVCISNCDKITPGMLMAAMRLNIPTVFVSGGPMEAGRWNGENVDLITAMIKGADTSVSDDELAEIESRACPGCGCCSGMFTANSMNCLTEALGLSLPGNGTILATHANRTQLFRDAARLIVENAYKYYNEGDESVLPRMMTKMEQAGVSRSVVGLVIPTGYSFNLDGTAIYLTMAAVFIAQACDVSMTLTQQLTLLAVLLLTSKGAAGVTGSGFIVLAATLSAVGHVPVAGLALILGIDRFMSEARAITNMIGNGIACVVVGHWCKEVDNDKLARVMGFKRP